MQTLAVQSCRTRDVAPCIRACLDSVRSGAAARGYRCEFIDARLDAAEMQRAINVLLRSRGAVINLHLAPVARMA